jgi:hypothetical protein
MSFISIEAETVLIKSPYRSFIHSIIVRSTNLVEEMEVLLLTSGITLVCLQDTLVGVVCLVAWSGTKLDVEALVYASVFIHLLNLSVTKTNTGRVARSILEEVTREKRRTV